MSRTIRILTMILFVTVLSACTSTARQTASNESHEDGYKAYRPSGSDVRGNL